MNDKNLLIALFALLERENAVSIPQISTLLGTDEETVWALLEDLVYAYDAVDLRLELGESHAELMRTQTSRLLRLTQSETALLLDALEAHGFGAEDELVAKLLATKGFLGSAASEQAGGIKSRSRGTRAGILEQLANACEDMEHHVLRVEYQKEGATNAEERLLEPHAIRSDGDHTLLIAFDRGRQAWRTFRVDRIKSVRVTDERFDPKQPQESGDASTAVIVFAQGAFPEDWNGLKKTRVRDDGTVEAQIPWYGSLWLPKKIIAHGHCQVQQPAELAHTVVEYAQSLLA